MILWTPVAGLDASLTSDSYMWSLVASTDATAAKRSDRGRWSTRLADYKLVYGRW